MAQDVPVTVPAIQAVTAATGVAEPMAPASPEPKRPRQRDTSAATAMVRDITLPELVGEFAALHHRFGIDETYVTHAVDAVDHNAVLLGEVLTRLAAAEAKLGIAETVVTQHKSEVMANATALDLQLRTELNAVTTRLGDEIRTDLTKVQESFEILKGIAMGAAAAAATANATAQAQATPTASPPGLPSSAAMEAAVTMLDARTTQLSATVQVLETDLVLLGTQVGAFQQASPAQHSSSAASAGVAEAFPATADGVARDMGGTG